MSQKSRDRSAWLGFSLISIVYWVCAGMRSAYRPIWYDEAVTWYIARQPSVRALFASIYSGVDQNLPLSHFAVRAAYAFFGSNELTSRLPALVGFWVMLLCLFLFLKRRLPLACVFAGTIFPMLTMAWQYSFEARSYSLMLGSGAAALFCWQAAAETEGRRRFWPLAGISVAFAAALSSHYMGVLLAIPFGAGELVRSLERKRIDKPMWAAFLVPTPLVLFYPGLLASVRSWGFSGARPTINSLSGFYPEVLQHAIAPMVVASVAAAVFAGFREQGEQPSEAGFPLHELVALIGFFIAPLPFFLVGMLGQTVTFVPRYGLLCVIGAAGLMSWLLARVTRGRNRAAAAFALALGVWLAGARFREASTDLRPPLVQVENANPILVSALQEGLPVMVAQPHIFLQADFYLPAAWLQHAYYVADAKPEAQYRSQELVDRITFLVAQQFPIRSHIVHWSDFRRNSRFLLHTGIANGYSYDEWIFDRLLREGWRLTVRAHNSVEGLYEVNAPTMVSQR